MCIFLGPPHPPQATHELQSATEAHAAEAQQLRSAHAAEAEQLRSAHADEVERLCSAHADEAEGMLREQQLTLADVVASQAAELEQLQLAHQQVGGSSAPTGCSPLACMSWSFI